MVRRDIQKVQFHFLNSQFSLRERSRLKKFILQLFKRERQAVESLNYIFCDDAYLIELNRSYLNHDTYTDIITFQLSSKNEPVVADVYISIERVKENSKLFHTSFKNELHRVLFHGVLHVCGYQDKTNKQTAEMRSKEEFYLERYFKVPRGTSTLKS